MICKSCGTQGKGKFCAHCGEKLVPDAATAPSSPAPVSIKPGRKERRLPPLSLKMVFWQSIALFLPLAYLFFDTFIFLSESLFGYSASGDMYLHRFVERLADLSYETNTVGEIAELTIGGADTLYHALSPLFFDFRWDDDICLGCVAAASHRAAFVALCRIGRAASFDGWAYPAFTCFLRYDLAFWRGCDLLALACIALDTFALFL